MDKEPTSGIERAVFGAAGRDDIDAWLSRHLHVRLGGDLAHIIDEVKSPDRDFERFGCERSFH